MSPTRWGHDVRMLLDTHIAIWAIAGAPELPVAARRALLSSGNDVYVSDVSAWEVAVKSIARPGALPFSSAEFVDACAASGYRFLPLSREAILAYEGLDYQAVGSARRDPFDRILIAQSKVAGMLFLTHDDLLKLYGEPHVVVV